MIVIRHIRGSSLAGKVQEFDRDSVVLGRLPSSDVVFDPRADRIVSGRHAEIRREGHSLVIEDQRSAGGTYVNGSRIAGKQGLKASDLVLLGGPGGAEFAVMQSDGSELEKTMLPESPGFDATIDAKRPSRRVEKASIGMNTLMNVVQANVKSERRRMLKFGVPAVVVLVTTIAWFTRSGAAARENWAEVFAKAKPSVYLVLKRQEFDGQEVEAQVGTAWCVDRDRGLLATNAHVAAAFKEDGQLLIARSTTDPVHDLQITKARQHPAYASFQELSSVYDPFVANSRTGALDVPPPFDVALFTIAESDRRKLPEALPLADADRIAELRAGETVSSVGFPGEGKAGGGTSLERPEATQSPGEVTRLADAFFGRAESPEEAVALSFNMNITGGASGSPVLGTDGRVVALFSAGDVAPVEGMRIFNGASYGPRVDLLRELLEDTAQSKQEARIAALRTQFLAKFRVGAEASRIVARVRASRLLSTVRRRTVKLELLEDFEVELDGLGLSHAKRVARVSLQARRTYVLVAVAKDFPQQPQLEYRLRSTTAWRSLKAAEIGHIAIRELSLPSSATIEVRVRLSKNDGIEGAGRVSLVVFEAAS
ncbi:MAG: trypsin-like peptidase domain-containing protein [Planctomycetes bacterium]|nr:trypsin-like peptidase domain-containing protein [Planctomycetota bacterium]